MLKYVVAILMVYLVAVFEVKNKKISKRNDR